MKLKSIVMPVLATALLCLATSAAMAQSPTTKAPNFDYSHVKPIIVNGTTYSYKDGDKFVEVISSIKHTVVESDGKVYGYTDQKEAQAHKQALIRANKAEQIALPNAYYATIYEHENFTGGSWDVPIGQQHTLQGNWWDDRISSIRAAKYGNGVTLYENYYFSGSTLYFAPGSSSDNFGWFVLRPGTDWHDQASSIKVAE